MGLYKLYIFLKLGVKRHADASWDGTRRDLWYSGVGDGNARCCYLIFMSWTLNGDSNRGAKLLSVEIKMDGQCRTTELASCGDQMNTPKFTTNRGILGIYDFTGAFTLVGIPVSL